MTPGATPPADDNFVAACPRCGKRIIVDSADADKSLTCPYCQQTISLNEPIQYDQLNYPGGYPQPQPNPQRNQALGWMIFSAIFIVGNILLFATTGRLIIPR